MDASTHLNSKNWKTHQSCCSGRSVGRMGYSTAISSIIPCAQANVELDQSSYFSGAGQQYGTLGYISEKHFRPGGMAPSEWTRSVRAVRATPVADNSAPGVDTTGRVAYRPPIAVSQFLLALSVSYFKHTLWRCGQL